MRQYPEEAPFPEDVRDVAERLLDERPTATYWDLERIKLRVQGSAPANPITYNARKAGMLLMKSRIAITLILALGLLMTTTGAAVGIQSLSGPPSAAQEQYGQQQETPPNPRPDEDQGGSQPDGQESPDGETAPEGDTSPEAIGQPEAAPTGQDGVTQAPAQVAASNEGGNLPFTGFVAIPVLIAGLALLLTGVGMRRSTRRGSQE